ncbi:hypothetical protein CAPTEDRAFT_201021 [Capitella teleta]|uniref:Methionyl/Leucyl tRNA synthetase domain-containing protein n=1 Tax=Capitella teleta TaxID=283909 RepID=R7UIC3_CAPTE|nr:hypothetical protein CAPTEDRAFT_201021 [Capitella teleta]|eukprot:ELU03533.1 hypothetical protein CAPTEDRAFT_201021 [Capitella teleta]
MLVLRACVLPLLQLALASESLIHYYSFPNATDQIHIGHMLDFQMSYSLLMYNGPVLAVYLEDLKKTNFAGINISLIKKKPHFDCTFVAPYNSRKTTGWNPALNNTHFGEHHTFASKKLRKSQFCFSYQYDQHNTHCDYRGYVV